jgi:hypothetical protein
MSESRVGFNPPVVNVNKRCRGHSIMIRIAALATLTVLAFAAPASANQSPMPGSLITAGPNLLENRTTPRICHICPGRPRMVCRCS